MNQDEITYLKQLEQKIDLILEALENQTKKEKLLGTWVSEKELMLMTGISRNTLLKLRQEGKITRSSISGKKNYYRLTDFKKLLDKNEE
ncbi:MAG: DNA-binding protein [Bacteroidetes bacterium]|nr:MAG: DNA-binding protein [Bacteroidota bacterium]